MIYIVIAILTIGISLSFYYKWHRKGGLTYWKIQNVAGPTPLPLVGNLLEVVLGMKHYSDVYDEIYESYPDAVYVGVFKMTAPAVVIRDLRLVQDILHTHFQSFSQNDFNIDENLDPLFAKNPFASPTEKWRLLRNQISPAFTLAKIKNTLPVINDISMSLLHYIETEMNEEQCKVFNVKELCAKYTIDVVVSASLGINGELFDNPKSEFYRMATNVFADSFINSVKNFSVLVYPPLNSVLRLPFVSTEIDLWLRHVVRDVLKFHALSNTQPTDFLQYLLELSKTDDDFEFTEDTVVGHVLTFLIEGFETSSTLMSFCLYELARNQNIQRNVQNELARTLKVGREATFDDLLNKLDYLDCVLFETLRLHPPVHTLNKVCTKEYKLPSQYGDSSDGPTIPAGTSIVIPTNAIHLDPNIYPKPNEFDPERFDKDNKFCQNFAFLSFGEGSRMCIGRKFGLAQSKYGIARILSKYNLTISSRTEQPLKISTRTFFLAAKRGLWIEFNKRD